MGIEKGWEKTFPRGISLALSLMQWDQSQEWLLGKAYSADLSGHLSSESPQNQRGAKTQCTKPMEDPVTA